VLVAVALVVLGVLKNQPQLASMAQSSLESLLTFVGLLYGVRKGAEIVKNGGQTPPGGAP